jgi:hypothetical protein
MQIPIPFTETKVDTDNPVEALKTMALIVIGFAALYFGQDLGLGVKRRASVLLGLGSEAKQANQSQQKNVI